jgi:hypothetical protein
MILKAPTPPLNLLAPVYISFVACLDYVKVVDCTLDSFRWETENFNWPNAKFQVSSVVDRELFKFINFIEFVEVLRAPTAFARRFGHALHACTAGPRWNEKRKGCDA